MDRKKAEQEGKMIELRNICKSYNKGAVRAVDGLTLAVPPGGRSLAFSAPTALARLRISR